jgi:NAD(P)-dependent dehydrogenase (short-subunit alcohol dehydrogenase family)
MIIITGASKGIGQYLYNKYINFGVDVIGTCNTTSNDNLIKLDVTNESEVIDFYNKLSKNAAHVTLINCAGVNVNALTKKFDINAFKNVIDVNLIGTFLMTKHALTIMLENKFGRIINISSVVPQIGIPGTAAYSSSKSALWGLSKTIAAENANKNITCNSLNLGYFNVGMIKEVPEVALEKILAEIPMQKLGDPINIYNAVEFLRMSDYITGTSLDINGGLF